MENAKNILITGGSGLIGRRLTTLLLARGYNISHLGRRRRDNEVRTFVWQPEKNEIETEALHHVDVIIHLAGAGVANKRWNTKRKNEILASRAGSARLLREALRNERVNLRSFISASGISYYGLEDNGEAFFEEYSPGDDFMARVTVAWEQEADAFAAMGARVVKIRTGVVLARESVALKKLSMPVKFFVGAPLGSGNQHVNWIHIDDLCGIYIKALEDSQMEGVYNAVAPIPVTNREMTREIAKALGRPLWLPPVPGFIVRLIAGDVAEVVLRGGKVSARKIQNEGFDFKYTRLEDALRAIYGGKNSNKTQRIFSGPIPPLPSAGAPRKPTSH